MGAPFPTPVAVATDPAAIFAETVLPRLSVAVGPEAFHSWFGRLELARVVGTVAHLSLPTRFLCSWARANYLKKLTAAVTAGFPSVSAVIIEPRSAARAAPFRVAEPVVRSEVEATASRSVAPAPAPVAEPAIGSPLDRRMTFDSFHVGRSNQVASAAAQRVAGAPVGSPTYNPLYLHSAVGLGKTHLLQATAQAAGERGRVLYMTAEKFMYSFVLALRNQPAVAFKQALAGVDILVIDDVQFLQGKSIRDEFARTVGTMIESGRQVVIAADQPPFELEGLDHRTQSRLAAGLVVAIETPDQELRQRLLEARVTAMRANMPGFDVSPAVIAYVASVIQTNGRDLDGAVNRLMAHASLTQSALTVETAEGAIRDLIRTREPKRVKIEDIQKLVARHYNVDRCDILSARRTANIVRPRQIAMYLSKVMTLRSLPEIGRRFGGRDHTTVLHAVRKIESLTGSDRALDDEVRGLRAMLEA